MSRIIIYAVRLKRILGNYQTGEELYLKASFIPFTTNCTARVNKIKPITRVITFMPRGLKILKIISDFSRTSMEAK